MRSVLDGDKNLRDVAIEGEIINFKQYFPSGTCYFSLQDPGSSIHAVMFGNYAKELGFVPRNGMKVIARGRVTLYEKTGNYQISVIAMFTAGQGAARLAVQKLKQKLASEGLFAPERKKKLPAYPFKIGVATSEKGAAIHDIISVARRRFPCTTIVLAPCLVQGDGAEDSIVQAVKKLDSGDADVIIIGRGGGGNEDLRAFDSEKVARAVAACKKPTVSAVGHETDFSVLDLICDARAATPTAAAEIVMPDIYDINMELLGYQRNIIEGFPDRIQRLSEKLENLSKSDGILSVRSRISVLEQFLSHSKDMAREKISGILNSKEGQIIAVSRAVENQSPLSLLKRGYSLIYKDGLPVKDKTFSAGDDAEIVTYLQNLECKIVSVSPRKEEKP